MNLMRGALFVLLVLDIVHAKYCYVHSNILPYPNLLLYPVGNNCR
jgi:hypothetical protein